MNLSAIILAISHLARLASTYGSHAYSSGNYNGTNLLQSLLPGTGGSIWPLFFAVLIILGLVIFFVLWRQRRKRAKLTPPTNLPS